MELFIYYFVLIRTLFSRGAVLSQERRSNSRSIFLYKWTNVVQSDDSIQFWNTNVIQAVRTILQRSNVQNGFRTAVLFIYFYRGRFSEDL